MPHTHWLLLGFRELPCLPSVCIPACTCWLSYRTEDLGDLSHACPYFIFKNKNSRGKIAKPSSMHRVSQASASPHFMLRSLDDAIRLRLPGRVGARPPTSPCADWLWLNEHCGLCSRLLQVQSCCRAPLPLSQASRVGVIWAMYPKHNRPGTHQLSQDDGQLSVTAGCCHICLVNSFSNSLHMDRSSSDPSAMLFIETSEFEPNSLCLNFRHNRGARVSTSRALDHSGGLFLVHSNVLYHYLPETRWLKTIARYHLTVCTSQKSRHRLHGFSLRISQSQNQSVGCNEFLPGGLDEFYPRPIQGLEESGPCVTVGLRSPLAGAPLLLKAI